MSIFTLTKIKNIDKAVEGYPQIRCLWEDGNAAVLWVKDRVFLDAKVGSYVNTCIVQSSQEPVLYQGPVLFKDYSHKGKFALVQLEDGKEFNISEVVDWKTLGNTIFVWTKEADAKGMETIEGTKYALGIVTPKREYAGRFITINTLSPPRRIRLYTPHPGYKTRIPARDMKLAEGTPPPPEPEFPKALVQKTTKEKETEEKQEIMEAIEKIRNTEAMPVAEGDMPVEMTISAPPEVETKLVESPPPSEVETKP